MKDGILITSERTLPTEEVRRIIELLSVRLDELAIAYSVMENEKQLETALSALNTADRIFIQPLEIYCDQRRLKDLKHTILSRLGQKVDALLMDPLLYEMGIIDILENRIRRNVLSIDEYQDVPPSKIQEKSFALIERGLSLFKGEEEKRRIVIRAIHATADFSIADDFYFHGDAVARGREAIKEGRPIITDVNMIAAGIGSLFHDRVLCAVADEKTKRIAAEKSLTRSAAAFELLKDQFNGAIAVVGNAPTALVHLLRMISKDGVNPALIIGVPVGFVGAAESKELLIHSGRPCISLRGNRGGSTIATAIVNALGNL
jgi:precorrin-8X/cobalt-precorrin-8 methylmutase